MPSAYGKCKIYEDRPTDCRLFPFDIVLDKASGEYWVGYYTDICIKELPQREEIKKHLHILRPYLFLLYPYANIVKKFFYDRKFNLNMMGI